jgi:GGDEF domain-containing protein
MLRLTPFRNMVKRLLGQDGQDAHSDAPTDRVQIASPGADLPSRRYAAISDRLTDLLAKQQSVATGKLHLINLDGLKERFGEQWESKAGRVASVMEAALQRHLSGRDFFSRIDDGAYVIIFEWLTERDATIKCALIAREVLQKLFGQAQDGTGVVIQTAVATVDGSLDVKSSSPLDVIAGLLDDAKHSSITIEGGEDERQYQPEEIRGAQAKAPAIAPIDETPVDVDRLLVSAERRVNNWQVYLPPKGHTIYDPTFEQSRTPKHTAVDLMARASMPSPELQKRPSVRFHNVKGIEFRYQPIWYAPKKAIVAYRCNLFLQSGDELIPAETLVQDDGLRDAPLMIDRLVLRRALSDLAQLLASDNKAIVIVPLHAASFGSTNGWRQLTAILSGITHEMRMLTFVEIVDVLAQLSDGQLPKTVRRLRSRARKVIARVPLYFRGFSQLRDAGFTGAYASVASPGYSEADLANMIGFFSHGSRAQGLRPILGGIDSASVLAASIGKGIEYFSGPLISEEQELPSAVKPFDLVEVNLARH